MTPAQPEPGPPRRALFLLALGFLLLTTRGVQVGDALVHLDTARGLVERGELALSFSGAGEETCGLVAPGRGGRPYSSLAPGQALAALPLVALGSLLQGREPGGDRLADLMAQAFADLPKRRRIELFREVNRDWRVRAYSLLGVLAGAAALVQALGLLQLLGATLPWLLLAGLVLLLSPLAVQAGTGWTQPLVSVLYLGAMTALWHWWRSPGARRAWILSLWLAAAVLVRPDCLVVLAAPLGLLLLATPRPTAAREWLLGRLLPLGVALLGAGLVLAGWNLLRFGSLAAPACSLQLAGWSAGQWPQALAGLLFSPNNGLVVYFPLVLAAGWGLGRLWRRQRRLAVTLLLLLAAHLLLYSFWWDWNGRMSYGPRRLTPLVPLLLAPAMLLWRRAGRGGRLLLALLAGAGAVVQLPGLLLSAQHLPDVVGPQAWQVASFVTGWVVLRGGAWSVPSDSWWPDPVACLSGLVPALLCLALLLVVAGGLDLGLWRRRFSRNMPK